LPDGQQLMMETAGVNVSCPRRPARLRVPLQQVNAMQAISDIGAAKSKAKSRLRSCNCLRERKRMLAARSEPGLRKTGLA